MMDLWEYKIYPMDCRDNKGMEAYLNSFGRDGWELVAVARFSFESIAYFKRRKQDTRL